MMLKNFKLFSLAIRYLFVQLFDDYDDAGIPTSR